MQRVLLVILVGFMIVLFAWNNMHHVEVCFVFSRPIQVRLVFLLLTTFLAGHFTAVLLNVYMRTRIKEKARREKMKEDAKGDEIDDIFVD